MSSNESNVNKSNDENNTSDDSDTCVVCFKNVEIYSIGECDHPVCFECSTRMRVLCQQNECPICRQVLGKVIFAYDKLPYRELEKKNRSEYYSKRYKIGFYNNDIQKRFFELLDHPCPKCNALPYRSFQGLRDHVRREHNLHYCDLCVDHLKIFTFERRCYTQAELGLHRAKGDLDNTSHRGHPLCEYCNKRYLDRDELFRHLRREHYFCHFCDADGCNEFYRDYDALAEHFRRDHYLCEEGKCATEQFVGAFRTEIDYKAHVASVHGKTLNKQQAKQTRTLQLEITLGPRGRGGQAEQNIANMRSRGDEDLIDELEPTFTQYQSQRNPINIDSQNDVEFPSLRSDNGANAPMPPLMPFPMRRSIAAGLARTKENFPALGGGGGGSQNTQQRASQQQTPALASMLKKTANTGNNTRSVQVPALAAPTSNSSNGSSMLIHVSNRPSAGSVGNGAIAKKPTTPNMEFPALPSLSTTGKGKKPQLQQQQQFKQQQQQQQQQQFKPQQQQHQSQQLQKQQQQQQYQNKKAQQQKSLEEDMGQSSFSPAMLSNVAAKHRTLVDDYVSVANPKHFQKMQMVQQEEADAKSKLKSAPKLNSDEFPTLGGGGSSSGHNSNSINNWVKPMSEKRQRELENRKSKVAPAPLVASFKENKSAAPPKPTNSNGNNQTKEKKNKEKKLENNTNQQSKSIAKAKEKNNNNDENKAIKNSRQLGNGNENSAQSPTSQLCPPPGFTNSIKPPPGFLSDVTINSVAKSPNNLTFTSSMGESYSIVPKHKYTQPPEALIRNQQLVEQFRNKTISHEAFEEFRLISQKFREGLFKANAYYEHCQAALGENFDSVFPELLALLPDISQQQSLYLVHAQRLNSMPTTERKSLPKLEVCSVCKQVLLAKDVVEHNKMHEFPALHGGGLSAAGKTATTGKRK